MKRLTYKNLLLTSGVMTVIVGMTYALRMYGVKEREVAMWGTMIVVMGALLVLLSLTEYLGSALKLFIGLSIVFSLVLQMPPVLLWLFLDETVMSDGISRSFFVKHWVLLMPHVVIIASNFLSLIMLIVQEGKQVASK